MPLCAPSLFSLIIQVVEVLEEEEEGWWRGKLDGKEGLFPSNFVELLVRLSDPGNKGKGKEVLMYRTV